MAKIVVKNSVTSGSAPAGLSLGEIAVNITDKKIFFGNAVESAVAVYDRNAHVLSFNGSTGAVSFVNYVSSVNGATGAITNIAVTNATQTFSGLQSFSTGISAASILAQTVGGDEGGQVDFGNPVTNTSLTGGVAIDIYQNKMRFFERGGSARGYYIDLTAGGAGVGTNLVGGSGATGATGATGTTGATGATGAIPTDYVISINGATGAITNVARTNQGNTFSVLQVMSAGITSAGLRVTSGATFTSNIDMTSATAMVQGYNTGGYLKLQSFGTLMGIPGNPSIVLQDADTDLGGVPSITINPSPAVVASNTLTLGNSNTTTTLNGTVVGATFSGRQTFTGGITAANIFVTSGATFNSRASFTSGLTSANLYVSSGATFNSTSAHTGLATFSGGVTASSLYVSTGSTFASSINLLGAILISGNTGTNNQVLTSTGSGITWATAAAGGGTKTYSVFTPDMNQPPASNYATLDTRNSILVLDFDASTDESAIFVGVIPEAASLGSGLKVRIHWMATSATTGSCRWGVQIERMNTDEDADSFDTAATAGSTTNGTSGIITTTEITITTIDSVAAGDPYRLKVYRDADGTSGTDDMTGDAELVVVEVRSAT